VDPNILVMPSKICFVCEVVDIPKTMKAVWTEFTSTKYEEHHLTEMEPTTKIVLVEILNHPSVDPLDSELKLFTRQNRLLPELAAHVNSTQDIQDDCAMWAEDFVAAVNMERCIHVSVLTTEQFLSYESYNNKEASRPSQWIGGEDSQYIANYASKVHMLFPSHSEVIEYFNSKKGYFHLPHIHDIAGSEGIDGQTEAIRMYANWPDYKACCHELPLLDPNGDAENWEEHFDIDYVEAKCLVEKQLLCSIIQLYMNQHKATEWDVTHGDPVLLHLQQDIQKRFRDTTSHFLQMTPKLEEVYNADIYERVLLKMNKTSLEDLSKNWSGITLDQYQIYVDHIELGEDPALIWFSNSNKKPMNSSWSASASSGVAPAQTQRS
jgi:hypothetical protein